uniref:Uncharacterized protein n=1 Tax=Anguilla anguilla TaxID=7936 RepID=A0A0E9XR98_ANGAN
MVLNGDIPIGTYDDLFNVYIFNCFGPIGIVQVISCVMSCNHSS